MSKRISLFPTALVAAIWLAGCAGVELREQPAELEAIAASAETTSEMVDPRIERPYDLEALLVPFLSLTEAIQSFDYFEQFAWGDEIFEDYLYRIFRLPHAAYLPGQGTILSVSLGENNPMIIEMSLLEEGADGERLWQVRQSQGEREARYEVHVSSFGVPVEIFYVHPESDTWLKRVPMIALSLEQALTQMTADTLREKIAEEREDDVGRLMQRNFGSPVIVGEEWVETPAGRMAAVHVSDAAGPGGELHYWLSPDVPGGVLMVSHSSPPSGQALVELLAITVSNRSGVPPGEVVSDAVGPGSDAGPEPVSEGTADEPVSLVVGDYHEGSVGSGEVSYYRLSVSRRADVYVEVSGFTGEAELYEYGGDATFTNWISASGGGTLGAQFYYARAGSELYFTVNDIEDDVSEGERYVISVWDDPVVDPIGVRREVPFRETAEELRSGVNVFRSLGEDGVSVFKVVASGGTRIVVTAVGVAEEIGLRWLDLEGGDYGSAYSSREAGTAILEIGGVSRGATGYFYLAGDPETPPRDRTFQLRIRINE
jgi:hypothetical protein